MKIVYECFKQDINNYSKFSNLSELFYLSQNHNAHILMVVSEEELASKLSPLKATLCTLSV